jgi:DUF4097 and DUF4098 domain-containing protein YvlB
MRPRVLPAALTTTFLAGAILTAVAPASPLSAAEVTKTLRAEISAAGDFGIENLAGTMKIVPGSGTEVVVIVTVHAESQAIADLVRLETVSPGGKRVKVGFCMDDDGHRQVPTLRVRYPIDDHPTLRYPALSGGNVVARALSTGSSTTTTYDDHRVKITDNRGTLLYADVEVQVPKSEVKGWFRNVVGAISARGLQGHLDFDSGSGDVDLQDLKGTVNADTGSGDVKIARVEGSVNCDTGSGDCVISEVRGDRIECDLGSGDATIRSSVVRSVQADTGSGDVRVIDSDIEELDADTGSGDVELKAAGSRLARVTADTGSGDVTLRLGADASFEARADQGSGDLTVRYTDAQPIIRQKEVVGYRRGTARIQIDVDTGSGDVLITPGT